MTNEQRTIEEKLPYTQYVEVHESSVMTWLGRMLSKEFRRNYYVDSFARLPDGDNPKLVLRLRKRITPWQTT